MVEWADDHAIGVRLGPFDLNALRGADEAFLNGTTTGVMPITVLDGEIVGNGQAGPVVRRLMELYDEAVATQHDAVR
jgi:branched-subunit amino acid aminotransferase/4-amino-4-deoxychorismate lyase